MKKFVWLLVCLLLVLLFYVVDLMQVYWVVQENDLSFVVVCVMFDVGCERLL